jgi:DNA-directed RNA polymerase specialized sigma24 family protein
MSSPDSISDWLAGLKAGDREAVQKLWESYFHRLVALARDRLRGLLPRRTARDEEDVALSAFASFVRAAEAGRFPRLEDRDDLWQVLMMVTARKAIDCAEHECRDKRDAWRTQPLADLGAGGAQDSSVSVFSWLIQSREPDPQFAAEMAAECERLLGLLDDDELRRIALLKMEGWTNDQITAELDLAPATVTRRLQRIRRQWAGEIG